MRISRSILTAAMLLATPCWAGTTLASKFEGNRVYVMPRAANGVTLTFYTDSGGGFLLGADAAARLNLPTKPLDDPDAKAELGPDAKTAQFPSFAKNEPIPPPPQQQVAVVPQVRQLPQWPTQGDGILGQDWFGGHVWTWDYPAQTFTLEDTDFAAPKAGHRVALGFKTKADGTRETNFPRIVIGIDGVGIPVLLDTGAETYLTPAALAAVNDGGPQFRATSMIAASLFDAWHAKHPDWRVIDDAQTATHSPMIEVPSVTIAGYAVGPVWFTKRADVNFQKYMSAMMSGPVEGALGGNALRHFRMTVDYPRATAWLTCTKECGTN
ncbi:MAG TPA: hypothetical protein VH000_07435 [Rhizomicrobium sp.]|nr:hypothetical protein [Rhizomicrobium sp.]